MSYEVVVPSVGRPSLAGVLDAVTTGEGQPPERVVVVDDRAAPEPPLDVPPGVTVLPGPARGPAAARNAGWRAGSAEWVVFLDDDVVPSPTWRADLAADLDTDAAGSQGRIVVPLPADRRPTDWERNVAGLERARYATADMAYRREVLAEVGGLDERFPRAFREDADLALRVLDTGQAIVRGRRVTEHPVPPAGPGVSVAKQAGNADDPLVRRLHGPGWRERAGAPAGRRPWHLATTALGAYAVARRSRLAASAWLALTADFAWRRIAPGPRTPAEVATVVATSVAIPPVATWHWLRGVARASRAEDRWPAREVPHGPVEAVLVDRDGTVLVDVPYNGDPDRVAPVAGARAALDRLRAAGLPVAVVTNQSGVGRGRISRQQVEAVNDRTAELLGPFDGWYVCPHAPEEGCDCRKPRPGLLLKAAADLGVDPTRCVVIGDIGSDVAAALGAGARPILVPTPETRREEVLAAPEVAADLAAAVDRVVGRAAARTRATEVYP